MATKGTLKTCREGHQFYKSTDCPVCPVCEKERKPKDSFLALIGAPARRALERENIKTLEDLAKRTEREIINLHGMGPGTLPKLITALEDKGLSFKS
jgi:predicted RecB family nuclease